MNMSITNKLVCRYTPNQSKHWEMHIPFFVSLQSKLERTLCREKARRQSRWGEGCNREAKQRRSGKGRQDSTGEAHRRETPEAVNQRSAEGYA
eukprot:TRINITY_DN6243_c0_g1_i1.p1 TRINITY_DN6243_c0_g1~~TRINITY_DN6243_c0_g1_i1.p1  ORF type:complete len:106 (+),score=1.48 TRINITY_DN6243_c0_g1_i1:40-318(+)